MIKGRLSRTWLVGLVLGLVVGSLGPLAAPAEAQYFGRNKVQYEDFDFRIIKTEHFDVFFYEEERDAAMKAARMSERWYARHARVMDHSLEGRQPLILYASHPHFRQTNALFGSVGEATGGVTEPLKRRVVMPLAGPLAETDHVLGHELVHAFQFSLTGSNPEQPMFQVPGVSRLPLWMVEGMAEYMAKGPVDPLTAMWIRDAMRRDDGLPTVSDLTNSRKYFPYRFGEALWAYMAGRWGTQTLNQIFRGAAQTGSPGQAIHGVLGVMPDTLSRMWHQAIQEAYGPLMESTRRPKDFGEPVVSRDRGGGGVNIGVSVSPDGERMVFLSEKSLFAIEMYLADARTGEIIRKITKTALDPHFQSLQFINSAGAWSADGRFAFAAVHAGRPVITVIEPESGKKLREVRLSQFGEVFNPTWSPDGEEIAFVANDGGVMDLFVLDLDSREVRRLTNDAYAELHPAWSPDGSRIAFVTDRFDADLENLAFSGYRLAVVDPESTEVRPVATFDGGKSVNPQWSPDGESLFFISSRDGIANVYRVELASGEIRQITDLFAGVSGITELSPVISVARESGGLWFGAFEKGDYNIYRADSREVLAGEPVRERDDGRNYAALPPGPQPESTLAQMLDDPTLGLPDPITFAMSDYNPGLSLDFVSQPSLAVGFSTFGSFVGGGAALHWSDMLGDHNLTTILQLQVRDGEVLNGVGALAGYTNRDSRWNWGALGGQIPQIFRFFNQGFADVNDDGQEEFVQNITTFWFIDRQLLAQAAYPFSSVHRVEFSGGFVRTDFEVKTDQTAFNQVFQRVADRTIEAPPCDADEDFRQTLCEPSAMNEGTVNAALVYDNAIIGPTGPILGQRYRFGVQPFVGTLDYTQLTTDYRKYVRPANAFTFATRLLHFGRYGSDANDDRLSQLYLGYPSLIRGYNVGSLDLSECPQGQALEDCSEFTIVDRLLGTRLAVANAEMRLPLVGPLGVLSQSGSVPPVTFVAFWDGGVAWTADRSGTTDLDERAFFLGGDRDLVHSTGAGARINLLGFAIAEIDWVYPFQRNEKGGYVQFSINPAF